jgi:hypothetical protein
MTFQPSARESVDLDPYDEDFGEQVRAYATSVFEQEMAPSRDWLNEQTLAAEAEEEHRALQEQVRGRLQQEAASSVVQEVFLAEANSLIASELLCLSRLQQRLRSPGDILDKVCHPFFSRATKTRPPGRRSLQFGRIA